MISLGVNDSGLSRSLLDQGKLKVDFLETSGPHVQSAVAELPQAAFLLHNGLWDWSLAHPEALTHKNALELTKARLELTHAPWLSVHLGFSAAVVTFGEGMQAVSEVQGRDELLATIVRNARKLAEALDLPLLLENLDFNDTGAYDHVCEPGFIHEAVTRSDVHFLLDIAHAQVSASRLGYSVQDYLAKLPLSRVRQLHVSGPRHEGETLTDAHEPLRGEDYALLCQVLEMTRPWAVTLEYGKDEANLLEQVGRLHALLGAYA